MEPSTRLTCKQCGMGFQPRNKNGVKPEFCSGKCRIDWHNGQRLKGAALLKEKKPPVQRVQSPGKRRVDLEVIPEAERPALLVEAARRLGLTEEGPLLTAARLAAQHSEPSTQHSPEAHA